MTRSDRPCHDRYVWHVTRARRCACATGGQCERARELLIDAGAEDWRRYNAKAS